MTTNTHMMTGGKTPTIPMKIGKDGLTPILGVQTSRMRTRGMVTHIQNGKLIGRLAGQMIPTAHLPISSGKIGKMKENRFTSLPNDLLRTLKVLN